MSYRWKRLSIPRLFGLDKKTNIVDVKDGYCLDAQNVYQNSIGVISKRSGFEMLFANDETESIQIDEIGTITIGATKYWFKFSNGSFKYATSATGAVTTISPAPAISTVNPIYWAVLDDVLFFVDGTNVLRYFDGSTIKTSSIYLRPTVALTTASGAGGFDYTYTVDNANGESPACATLLVGRISLATVVVTGNTGPQTLAVGDKIRIYSKATGVAAGNKNVTPTSGGHVRGFFGSDEFGGFLQLTSTFGTYSIVTVAISDATPQLYNELGIALNFSAPTALRGITTHYGRLVGWSGSRVFNAKISNPHSWPTDSARSEAFVYGFGLGDSETIEICVSYQESLYVMKPTKIAVFAGIGPDDTGGNAYSYRRLETNGIGCVGGKSAVVMGEESENYLIFLSKQGFYATNGTSPTRIGEKIETNLIGSSGLSNACAYHDKRRGLYICFTGASTARKGWVFDARKDEGNTTGWFSWSGINAECVFWDDDRFLFGTFQGFCGSERITGTSGDFADMLVEYFPQASVSTGAETVTVVNSYETGQEIVYRTSGGEIGSLDNNVTYFVIRVSATLIRLATTAANAAAGNFINLTPGGSGTHSFVTKKAIDSFYVTNWIKFGSPSLVKKLLKPTVILNAVASSVLITMKTAFDWVPTYGDSKTIAIGSSDAWGGDAWGSFVWAGGTVASPKNVAIARRKCRSISYRFENAVLNQDFSLQGIEQEYDFIRNRGNYAA